MAPKQVIRPGPRSSQPKGYAQTLFEELTSPDNRSVIIAVSVFAVSRLSSHGPNEIDGSQLLLQAGVAFLHTSMREILLPP